MKIRLVKDGCGLGKPLFGTLPEGHELELEIPDRLDEPAAKRRAFEMLRRSNPDENGMEWRAEVVPS